LTDLRNPGKATLNMNDLVSVRLTDAGLTMLDKYETDLGVPYLHRRSSVTEANLWRGPLWSLMQEFGPNISMGMNDGPFVDNRIDWENTSEQSVCDHRYGSHGDTCVKCGKGAY
jgi:hypothetical protein